MQTPVRPVAQAYPSAACPAPCSCLTSTCRSEEDRSGSYAGKIAPPGRPNTTSTPWHSRLRTSAWAPVTSTSYSFDNKKPPGRSGRGGVARARRWPALRDKDYSELDAHVLINLFAGARPSDEPARGRSRERWEGREQATLPAPTIGHVRW